MKSSTPARPRELTPEEKADQIARFLSQKRESFALSFFAGLSHQAHILTDHTPQEVAAYSVEAADALMEILYPIVKEGEEAPAEE